MKTETNNIHHACRCTGQKFTFEEWGKYLKESHDDIVHCYKNFCFNIFDVCLTPNVKIEWANKFCNFEIITAQSDNERWDFGLHYNFWVQGGCCGAHYVDTPTGGHNTEKEAINAALNLLEEKCQRVISEIQFVGGIPDEEEGVQKSTPVLAELKRAFAKIAYYKDFFNPRQLELF